MPRTPRNLSADMKSVRSISYRPSTDGADIVVTNTYAEHDGRPLLLSSAVLEDMLSKLKPVSREWERVSPVS